MPFPKPAETAPRPSHIVLISGGAMATVQTVPHTPCKDCVAPMKKRTMYIWVLSRSSPKMKLQAVFKRRLIVSKNFGLHLCRSQPHGMDATTMPILSIEPKRPNSNWDHELFISSCMVFKLAGSAPPSYDMNICTPWHSKAKTNTRAPRDAKADAGSGGGGLSKWVAYDEQLSPSSSLSDSVSMPRPSKIAARVWTSDCFLFQPSSWISCRTRAMLVGKLDALASSP
mmetsp:Transcript_41055/g.113076  ORF Transcript_41055/g.113076 Transcript_41055/m.113076 type:complete len:227 (+) Transcript_41055:1447-2127(+)